MKIVIFEVEFIDDISMILFIYFFIIKILQVGKMKEKRVKPRYNAEFKTFNSEQSCIDVFSKVESLFL